MLALPTSVRIYLASAPVDLRKSIDGLGAWTMSLWDNDGNETPEDQVGVDFPELVEPLRIFHECLDRFPTTPYSEPLSLDPAQREMYWGYFVTELVPCLRDRRVAFIRENEHKHSAGSEDARGCGGVIGDGSAHFDSRRHCLRMRSFGRIR